MSDRPGLRRLIHEIHRRSLWQVVGIYVGGSWVTIEVVRTLTETLEMPGWFPQLAVILLIIGLPVVVATAFVQVGVRTGAVQDAGDASVADTPSPASETRMRELLTWRNALLGGVGALALWGVVAAVWLMTAAGPQPGGPPAAGSGVPSIAVLPFENRSALPDDAYFTDGIHDEIITRLSRIHGLSVRGRTSVMQYRSTTKSVREIGDELNAAFLLEGGVQRAGDAVRINVQLIDAAADEHIWSDIFDRPLTVENLLGIQSQIAGQIAAALEAALTPEEEARIAALPTSSLEAYQLFLQARAAYRGRVTGDDVARSIEDFERAIGIDRDFAEAHASLALSYSILPIYVGGWEEHGISAERSARTALALDSELADAQLALANVLRDRWDWADAAQAYRLSLDLDAESSEAHSEYGEFQLDVGQYAEAVQAFERAVELDPRAPVHKGYLAVALTGAGRIQEALEVANEAVSLEPERPTARFGLLYAGLPTYESGAGVVAATVSQAVGRFSELALEVEQARTNPPPGPLLLERIAGASPWFAVAYLARLDQREMALRTLEQWADARFGPTAVVWTPAVQILLAGDPRFDAVLDRMGLSNR